MSPSRPSTLQRALTLAAGLLVFRVTVATVLKYRDYFPPNFDSEFLRGRELTFPGSYEWAFYAHIVSGPPVLLMGLVLLSESFRRQFPKGHRYLGRIQVPLILFVVLPSGFWMAREAEAGPVAAVGFSVLALVTALCAGMGWRTAIKRRFLEHRRWMWRTWLLLCSAVVIRVVGGLVVVTGAGADWIAPLAAWACWLAPLAVFEALDHWKRRGRNSPAKGTLTATAS